ncbi:MAG: PhzF family phenazine biosynthesis protein [Gemmatimonadaceae bacterium]
MTDSYSFHTLDVFTDTLFGGNPLAVLTDARGLTTEQMEHITREFNLSETVFVLPPENPTHTRRVRIFTPGRELPFAGHPTVGTAFLLAATGMVPLTEGETHIVLEEGVGPVAVTIQVENGAPISAELTAAQAPEFSNDVPNAKDVAAVLSLNAPDISTGEFAPEAVSCGVPFLIAPLVNRDAVSRARLDRAAFERVLSGTWAPEIFLFDVSAATTGGTIRARMFAPDLGIGEDPATGSAAVCLAGYLAKRSPSDGTLRWTVAQGVEMGRPSTLMISAERRNGAVKTVRVAGKSVLVSDGTLRVR